MSYTDRLKEIEKKTDVDSIKYKGLSVWPVLRYYFCVTGTANKIPKESKKGIFVHLIRTTFFGFKNYFKKHDYLLITSSSNRILIKNKYTDKFIDEIAGNLSNSWILEQPIKGRFMKSNLPSNTISSKYPLAILTWLISRCIIRFKVENEKAIKEVLKELDITVDYKILCKTYYAQYRVMLFLAKWHKFKAVYIVVHYTNMGYIKALRELEIPVIEVQHGLISRNHCAYNIYTPTDLKCYPNYLLTFGKKELSTFQNDNLFISREKVIAVGHLYIDHIASNYEGDKKLKKIQKNFRKTIAVSSQNHPTEPKLIEFIKTVAELDESILFVFVPRTYSKNTDDYNFPKNIILTEWLDVYQVIWHSDIHSTVFSTCALEAPSIGVKNVLINIENMSKHIFDDILNDKTVTRYSADPLDYLHMVNSTVPEPKNDIIEKNKEIIVPGYKKNIKSTLKYLEEIYVL